VNLRVALLAPLALLAACATVQPPAEETWSEQLSGRLAVHVDAHDGLAARNVNASFDLRGDARHGELLLSTPLGTVLARARWSPGEVVLKSSDGEKRFANLAALSEEVLGEAVPLEALFDWLHGRPWAGAPHRAATDGGFEQLGWLIDLSRRGEGSIQARRTEAPVVTVRARLDTP
jgi:outer membrane lipoprotein LolB